MVFYTGIYAQDAYEPIADALTKNESTYIAEEIDKLDFANDKEGYWLFLPKGIEENQRKNVVVFIHGYGGLNPFIYGGWIKHLALQGHPVIYPRYQKKLNPPRTKQFVPNAVAGLKAALLKLEELGYDKKLWNRLDYTVHSYGGVISANIVVNQKEFGLPEGRNMLLCSPGSGPFKGGVLENYNKLPENINLLIVTSEFDITVGDKLGTQIFRTAVNSPNRVYLRQYSSKSGNNKITAGHNECYALDMEFDNGTRNYTSKKALRVGKTDLLDLNGYWKLMDELIEHGSDMGLFKNEVKEWPLGDGLIGLEVRVGS